MLALNRRHIDFFSLDVEGVELDILKTIPFDRLDIRALTVEYNKVNRGGNTLKTFFQEKGYTFAVQIDKVIYSERLFAHDLIFYKI